MQTLGSFKGGNNEGDWGVNDTLVVVNKLNGGVWKTKDSQGKVFGKLDQVEERRMNWWVTE